MSSVFPLPDESTASREFAIDVVRQLRAAGAIAYWAGGCVRDLLMGQRAKDYDVATSAPPEQVRTLFGKKRTLSVGASFGVIVVLPTVPGAEPVEVATFRTEGPYHDGRRPSQVAFATPEEDARRRDFTINGMFYDPLEQRVLDFVGGQADIEVRRLRAIGNPLERMTEDKLRMLRAVRFAATLEFELDPQTRDAVRQMAGEIQVVSAERIAQELRRVLAHPQRARGFELMRETALLPVLFPELVAETQSAAAVLAVLPKCARFELAAAAMWHTLPATPHEPRTSQEAAGSVWDIARRLKLSAYEMQSIAWLVSHQNQWHAAILQTDAQLKRVLAHPLATDLRHLVRALAASRGASQLSSDFIDTYLAEHSPEQIHPPELVSGRDLIESGLRPGPRFKEILDALRDAQLNGELRDRSTALERMRTMIAPE